MLELIEVIKNINYCEIGFGKVIEPLCLSLVGAMKGSHLFDIMELFGKEECISRIQNAIHLLN